MQFKCILDDNHDSTPYSGNRGPAGRPPISGIAGDRGQASGQNHVFRALKRLGLPVGEGGVICLVEQLLPLSEDAYAIPVAAM